MRLPSAGLLLFLSACLREAPTAAGPILVGIEQDDRLVVPVKGVVRLHRRPFTLLVRLPSQGGVHLNASEKPDTIKAMATSDDFDDIPGFNFTGMAESDRNPEREIVVRDDSSHYWDADRFDSAPKSGIGRRSVSRIVMKGGSRWTVGVADYPYSSLHLALATGGFHRNTNRQPTAGLEVWSGIVRVADLKDAVRIEFVDF